MTDARTASPDPAGEPLEIERKFLLTGVPDGAELERAGARASSIEQTYLASGDPDVIERVRRRSDADGTRHVWTEKRFRSAGVNVEHERDLTATEYAALLERADPSSATVAKTRHVFEHAGRTIELDVFHGALEGLVVCEVELDSLDADVQLPSWLGPIEDVTEDRRYGNAALARAGAPPAAASAP
jgi:CYTH domain-containing protein